MEEKKTENIFPYKIGDRVLADEYGIGVVTSIHPEENGLYARFPDNEHPFLKIYEVKLAQPPDL